MSMVPNYYGGHRGGIFDPFSMDMWDPFKDFHRYAMSTMPHSSEISRDTSFVNTCIDWRETQEAHVFKADLLGLKKEEVKVELADDKVLQISGERYREVEQSSDMWHRVERSSGKFMRWFRLPDNVKIDQIRASMENGVLIVTVPKEEARKRDIRAIAISG